MAYYSIEPWGPERMELSIAMLTSLTANIHRDSKKRPEPYTAKDFLPQWDRGAHAEDDLPGMAPDHVMKVMETLMEQQARQAVSTKVGASLGHHRGGPGLGR